MRDAIMPSATQTALPSAFQPRALAAHDYVARKLFDDLRAKTWDLDDELAYDLSRESILRCIAERLVREGDIPVLRECAEHAGAVGLRCIAIHCCRARSNADEWTELRALARALFDDPRTPPESRCYLLFQITHRADAPESEHYLDWCWQNPRVFAETGVHYWNGDRSLLVSSITSGSRSASAYKHKFPLYACQVAYMGTTAELPWLREQAKNDDPTVADVARRALEILELRSRFGA